MTYFYRSFSVSQGGNGVPEETRKLWEHIADKKNWRIVQLPNGYFQAEYEYEDEWKDVTRRETLESCEAAIDASIEHYQKRLELLKGPKVVKTFN
jgi:pyruvate-formate lyase-activating enzyme